MSYHSARNDTDAHNRAMELPVGEVVRELVDLLGATNVAALAGVKETRAVQEWMSGREPQKEHLLRFALQLVLMVAAGNEQSMAKAWLNGANPALGGATPLSLLRNRPLEEIQSAMLDAARTFAARVRQTG